MKIIGITGGVGSGKSEVLNYLREKYKAVIMEADKEGHRLLSEDTVYAEIVDSFGEKILDDSGKIDREKLGVLCFAEPESLEKLNSIIHPAVKAAFLEEVGKAKNKGVGIFVIEAALLIECGYKELLDSLWYVYCEKNIRIDRLMKNRGYSREKSESIIKNQLNEELYRKNCDIIIDNSDTFQQMYSQVDRVILSAETFGAE